MYLRGFLIRSAATRGQRAFDVGRCGVAPHRHQADYLEQKIVEHDVLADKIDVRGKKIVRNGLSEHYHRSVAFQVLI